MTQEDNGQRVAEELEALALKETAETVEGFMSGSDSMPFQQKLGVLQRIVTSVANDKEYRQILLLAAFENKQEALLAADAIAERQRYGVPIQPILDRIVAECSVKSDRVDRVLRAMTSYTLNTNAGGKKLPFWKRKQETSGLS